MTTYMVFEDDEDGNHRMHMFSSAAARQQWYIEKLGIGQPPSWFWSDPDNRLYIDEHDGHLHLHWVWLEYNKQTRLFWIDENEPKTLEELKQQMLEDDNFELNLSIDRSTLIWRSLTGSLTKYD